MEFVLIVILVGIIKTILFKPKSETTSVHKKIVVQKKECPPHQWFWQEVVDQHGEKQPEQLVCKICKHTPSQARGDK